MKLQVRKYIYCWDIISTINTLAKVIKGSVYLKKNNQQCRRCRTLHTVCCVCYYFQLNLSDVNLINICKTKCHTHESSFYKLNHQFVNTASHLFLKLSYLLTKQIQVDRAHIVTAMLFYYVFRVLLKHLLHQTNVNIQYVNVTLH